MHDTVQTPDQTPDGWSRVAEAYEAAVSPFLAQYAEDALDLTDLGPGERVLDVAAGAGGLSLLAARRGADVLATDFAPGMVERLRDRAAREGLDLRVECMDGQDLDLPDEAFDAAYSNLGVIFFPDRAAGFRELARVLRPGGRAGVTAWSDPANSGFMQIFQAAVSRVAPDLPPPERPPAAFSLADPERFEDEMRAGGFETVEVHTVTHAWELDTPEDALKAMTTTNPVMPALIARLGPDKEGELHTAMLRVLRDRHGTGRVVMESEAYVAVGRV